MSDGLDRSPTNLTFGSTKHDRTSSVATASSPAQLKAALHALRSRHASVTADLDGAIASHADISRQLARLDLSRARLGTLSNTAHALSHNQLSSAAATASRLSDAVSRLDLEQERVKATLAVVEQVSELKACVLGVVGSMGAPQDWETAAEYISRASKIPRDVVDSGFAEDNVPTAEVPDPPAATLDNAAKSLCQLFLREFGSAVEQQDGAKITRFFKMFPLIGRSKEGLDAYGRYVCQGVAIRARGRLQGVSSQTDGSAYVGALTKLFEHIAQVVDGHSNLVQRHYGVGTMVKVMERLHAEADVQGGIVLDTWNDERAIDRKLTDVKSYAYTFLVQSFLPVPRGTGTPRSISPAPGATRKGVTDAPLEDGIEMREIDHVLSEITSMLGHWSLYVRFVSSRAVESETEDLDAADLPPLTIPEFLANSNLPRKVSRLLIEPFKTFATFFLRRSVEKAFQLEEKPAGLSMNPSKTSDANPPYITSAVDDVMYMVNQVIQRSLATSQATVVTAILSSCGRVLGSDFIGMIQRKMRDESYPKAAVQGTMPPEDKIISFLVLTNNLDVAMDYIKRIVHSHLPDDAEGSQANGHSSSKRPLSELFPMDRDAITVRTSLTNLESSFCSKASDLIEDGLQVAFSHILKPRMRTYLAEVFRDVDYSAVEDSMTNGHSTAIDSEEGEEAPSVKTVAQRGWDIMTKPMKKLLTAPNSDRLMLVTTAHLSALLEKRIWNYQGRVSALGGIKLERDVADIVNVAVKTENYRLREVFTRCLQIVSIMNMEEDEWEEVGTLADEDEGSDDTWALNSQERHRARAIIRERD